MSIQTRTYSWHTSNIHTLRHAWLTVNRIQILWRNSKQHAFNASCVLSAVRELVGPTRVTDIKIEKNSKTAISWAWHMNISVLICSFAKRSQNYFFKNFLGLGHWTLLFEPRTFMHSNAVILLTEISELLIQKPAVQWTTVEWDSDSWMGQLPKPLYNCQNVTQMNMLLHFSPRHTSCKFHYILRTLRWFWKLSHSAVAVPHHCRPLYIVTQCVNYRYL